MYRGRNGASIRLNLVQTPAIVVARTDRKEEAQARAREPFELAGRSTSTDPSWPENF